MKRLIYILSLSFISICGFSQEVALDVDKFKPNPEKERIFRIYILTRHREIKDLDTWKKNNTVLYYKELWYFSSSFYIKRNYLAEGIELDEGIIDITRFESNRKEDEESIVILPGFKDALILLPNKSLIYKPNYQ